MTEECSTGGRVVAAPGDGPGAGTESVHPLPERSDGRALYGYGLVAGSFVIIGLSGTLVTWATAPESVLIVARFAIAAVVLSIVFARRRPLAGLRGRGLWRRLLLMGAFDAGTMLAYFFAIRATGVAIATFLFFLQPVWIALLAPRFLRTPTERVVFLALGVALAGMVVILAPSLLGDASLSTLGLLAGLASGFGYTFFQLIVKGLTREVSSVTIVIVECTLDALIVLPLAAWQLMGAASGLTANDVVAILVLGLLCTAVAYTMWVEGLGMIRVQHSSILGFLTPLAAPVIAFVLLGQEIAPATIVGGALILAAGVVVVAFGKAEVEPVG